MGQLFVNNLTLTLSEDVVTNQPTLSVVSSTGLPTFQVGDWLYLTLTDIREGGELRWEIVKVTSWTGTTLTVVRGQDGTAAQAWLAGAKASLRVTAADMTVLEAAATPAQLLTAIKTVDGSDSGLDADLLDGQQGSWYSPLNSPTFTGTPTAPTAAVGTNTTQLATTAFVQAEIANDAPTKTGGGASGTWGINISGNAGTVTNGVYTTGNQTIAGVKTFSSSPIVPTATTATQAINSNSIFGFKNHIINGNFDIWQRGPSIQVPSGQTLYTADRWTVLNNTNQTLTVESAYMSTFGLEGLPRARLAFAVAPTSGNVVIAQRIERLHELASKTVTTQFLHTSLESMTISAYHLQAFGVGGSASVQTNLPSTQSTGSLAVAKYVATASLPSVLGKTVGAGAFTDLSIVLPIRTTNPFSIAQVQLEEGSVATPFEHRPVGLELSLCQRYYEISGLLLTTISGDFPTGYWKVSKRTAPTISLSIGVGSGATVIPNISADLTIGFYQNTPNSVATYSNVTASAEI